MRKPFVAGNWKMNTTGREAVALAKAVAEGAETDKVDVAVCPPFVYLDMVRRAIEGGGVALGAQNMYFEREGAFTGEISGRMLTDVGCRYVILGHSERRHVIGETNELIREKMRAALDIGLRPILCVGETLVERQDKRTFAVVGRQVRDGLAEVGHDEITQVTLAYEPVWAIGTGKNAAPAQVREVHAEIRRLLGQLYSPDIAEHVRIQYGGSVKPDNAADILSSADVDGALVGGASLKAESFLAIARAAV